MPEIEGTSLSWLPLLPSPSQLQLYHSKWKSRQGSQGGRWEKEKMGNRCSKTSCEGLLKKNKVYYTEQNLHFVTLVALREYLVSFNILCLYMEEDVAVF